MQDKSCLSKAVCLAHLYVGQADSFGHVMSLLHRMHRWHEALLQEMAPGIHRWHALML